MTSSAVPAAANTQFEAVAGVIAVLSYAINPLKYRTLRQLRAQFRTVAKEMERWIANDQLIRQQCSWQTFRQYLPESAEFWGEMKLEDARALLIAKYGIGATATDTESDSN